MNEHIEFISAGAGSGKTYSLTEKLNALLSSGEVQPSGVIATTFTRLAAGELRERVRQSLMQSGHRQLANEMGQASINTVNSVCGELLQRFAFIAGLSPEQQVLEEGEGNRLFSEALDRVIGDDMGRVRELNALARRLSIEDDRGAPLWRRDVNAIVKLVRANDCSLDTLPAQGQQSAQELLAFFRKPVKRDLNAELIAAIETALERIDTDLDATKGTQNYLSSLRSARRRLSTGHFSWSEWIKLSKSAPTKKSLEHAEPVTTIAGDVERHPRLHQDITDYTRAVFQLAADSLETYQQLKRQQGLVDFVDQEQQLYRLLDDPEVQNTLRQELQLLMVDEFQDTSPIQLALFVRLAALADRVIWVGDIKQSIYGFRGSDPELMRAVVDAVQAGGGQISRLEKSWRSRPSLVHYCNTLFKPAFANTLSEADVELKPEHAELTDDPAVITWQLPKKIDSQLDGIAAGMRELVANGYSVVDKHSRTERPLRLGDIAVLCRSNARLQQLASACARAGIAVSYKRPGLLATPECTLALACLRRMADARDTLATAEIKTLGDGQDVEQWLPQRLEQLADTSGHTLWGESGSHASARINALADGRRILDTLTPTEALNEAMARGDVRSVINCWGPSAQRSRQRMANLDRLCELAVDYEQHCDVRNLAATVSGLLMWLGEQAQSEEDWQATTSDDDTVTLVTYHGAKGLEWPVVVATDLDSPLRTRLWGATVLGDGQPLDVSNPLVGRRIRFWPFPFGKQATGISVKDQIEQSALGQGVEQQAQEEEKRLLYVTFTRARDLLVLPEPEGKRLVSLDVLGKAPKIPHSDTLVLPGEKTIPTALQKPQPDSVGHHSAPAVFQPHWLPELPPGEAPIARGLTPSLTEPVAGASVGQMFKLGSRIELGAVDDMSRMGNALHGVITAEIQNGGKTRENQVHALLSRFGVDTALTSEAVLNACREFIKACNQRWTIIRWLPEYPIRYRTAEGQEVNGFIDLLLETPEGWVIIDHKTAPQPRSHWPETVSRYSGQLALYRDVVASVTGKPVRETWLHLVIAAALVEVTYP